MKRMKNNSNSNYSIWLVEQHWSNSNEESKVCANTINANNILKNKPKKANQTQQVLDADNTLKICFYLCCMENLT